MNIRPQTLDDYVGQKRLKKLLAISIAAAKRRGETLGHLLVYGPAGTGKTSISQIVANEMSAQCHITSAPNLENVRDLIGILHQLEYGDVLFIDEIHRLKIQAQEILYPAMEDFVIDMTSGRGNNARTTRIPLPKFTLIGATTKAGMVSNPLRDRFALVQRLEMYDIDELSKIVARTAGILGTKIEPGAVAAIALGGRGAPRIANKLVHLVRDYAQSEGSDDITTELAQAALSEYQLDAAGLDATDRKYLQTLIETYGGGPVGIETLAATVGEDVDTLADVYEPYLIQKGFLARTSRGRSATELAYQHIQKAAA